MDYILLYKRKIVEVEVDEDLEKLPLFRNMISLSSWRLRWDYEGWRKASAASPYTQKEWNYTIITRINEISAQIHRSILNGGADTIIISPEFLQIFDDLDSFHSEAMMIGSRYEVITNKHIPNNQILICKAVSDEQEYINNNKLIGLITVDNLFPIDNTIIEKNNSLVDNSIKIIDRKYLLLSN